jgi:trehalose 6-phosphate synthase
MNLVAKEFCAARVDKRGVLVLSEFAGAACELKHHALVVNPHDTERMASVLYTALRMEDTEQKMRMESMRSHLCRHDVFRWARTFTDDAIPAQWNNRIVGNFA